MVFVVNIVIGAITPPVGTIMYVSCLVGNVSVLDCGREGWPFVAALVICLFIVTHVPWLALWLPDLLMPAR